jgi:hypothetical protein
LLDFITSDHKPVTVVFNNLRYERSISTLPRNDTISYNEVIVDWSKADMQCLMNYQFILDSSHASAVAQGNVVRAMSDSYGKSLYSTLRRNQTP